MKIHQTQEGSRIMAGVLLGTAAGDSLGLPAEGMSPGQVRWFFRKGLRHRLILGRGMLSDDTEHSLMVAAALARHPDDVAAFQRSLGRSLRWWFAALPAGVGLSTAKAIFRLWLGIPPARAGVRSAGNGAAMRSAVIGAFFREDPGGRRQFAEAACVVTHTDRRAVESALLVAEAAALAAGGAPNEEALLVLERMISSGEMRAHWALLVPMLARKASVEDFAGEAGCGRGVSGFAPHTVAVALYAWLRYRGGFWENGLPCD